MCLRRQTTNKCDTKPLFGRNSRSRELSDSRLRLPVGSIFQIYTMILSQNGMAASVVRCGVAMPLANMYPDQPTPPFKVESTCFHLSRCPLSLLPLLLLLPFILLPSFSLLPLLFMAEFKRASWGGRAAQQSTQHSAEGNARG